MFRYVRILFFSCYWIHSFIAFRPMIGAVLWPSLLNRHRKNFFLFFSFFSLCWLSKGHLGESDQAGRKICEERKKIHNAELQFALCFIIFVVPKGKEYILWNLINTLIRMCACMYIVQCTACTCTFIPWAEIGSGVFSFYQPYLSPSASPALSEKPTLNPQSGLIWYVILNEDWLTERCFVTKLILPYEILIWPKKL